MEKRELIFLFTVVLCIFVIILGIFKYIKCSTTIVCLMFISIIYYANLNSICQMRENFIIEKDKENYNYNIENKNMFNPNLKVTRASNSLIRTQDKNSDRFCNDSVQLDSSNGKMFTTGAFNNEEYESINQKLAGPQNPRILIPPVIVPSAMDLDYWKANNFVNHSAINSESNIDVYRSGYQISNCCNKFKDSNNDDYFSIEEFNSKTRNLKENFQYDFNVADYKKENSKESNENLMFVKNLQPGQINMSCGYNPEQAYSSGLPSNFAAGNCNQNPSMKNYNSEIFTQTIQPGIYTRNEIIEPINSNIGISFQQQFEPTTIEHGLNGEETFIRHDPRTFNEPQKFFTEGINESNVYDPRFTGYGTSYRSYTDDNTGQTKFYYDDVNSIRMPNYLIRSNIDHENFADQYGPIKEGNEFGNANNSNIREMANDAFLNGSLQQRNDLMERQMRKANDRMWQRRIAPIRTGGQRMAGGMSLK
jgi:hypothetical protein